MAICLCDCGQTTEVKGTLLRNKSTKSCGCWRKEFIGAKSLKHGGTRGHRFSPEYSCWMSMRARCLNSNHKDYARYRNVPIYSRWKTDFARFLRDVGPRPSPSHSLDRIKAKLGYVPGNVRWATKKEQAQNSVNAHFLEHAGKRLTIGDWARELKIHPATISSRLQRGWGVARALDTRP